MQISAELQPINQQRQQCATPSSKNGDSPGHPKLSARHVEIPAYAAKGLTNADIARVLGIGVDCIKAHMKTAFSRLEASNRSEAVALALRKNLLNL